jgi:hypothetical protein
MAIRVFQYQFIPRGSSALDGGGLSSPFGLSDVADDFRTFTV